MTFTYILSNSNSISFPDAPLTRFYSTAEVTTVLVYFIITTFARLFNSNLKRHKIDTLSFSNSQYNEGR